MPKLRSVVAVACAGFVAAASGEAFAQALLMDRGAPLQMTVTTFRDVPFKTVVRQQYDYSCGSAALATLLKFHYGRPTGEAEIFKSMYAVGDQEKIKKVGFSLLDMKRYLDSLGYKAEGYQLSLNELLASKEPVITMITVGTYKHFVVLKGLRDGEVLIGDPALGLRTYSVPEFANMWQGVILTIEQAGRPIFNRAADWSPYGSPLRNNPLDDDSLAAFSRDLPPIYQITPVFNIPSPQ
jgi:uncharacterized protein